MVRTTLTTGDLKTGETAGSKPKVRTIAFYLPQFHPIPENDTWWSKGFTEWTNVAKARAFFKGHYQPQLPADLGFYDLRLPEAREAQAALAEEYGIHGFCYYHYWFGGRRLLERPFHDVLTSGKPDFPFCLCWANENWTRTWDGQEQQFLMQQSYSEADDLNHIRWLATAFHDPRYIRIAGKPVFLIYRASKLPDSKRTTSIWREEALRLGIGELYLCRVESFYQEERTDPVALGFDAAVEFQPDWPNLGEPTRRGRKWRLAARLGIHDRAYFDHKIRDYADIVRRMLQRPPAPHKRFPCVTPGFDSSPRRKENAIIIHGSTPELYEDWLRQVIQSFTPPSPEENLLFINAWNEWGESNHLEPCQRWGRAYLEATRRALLSARARTN